TEWKEQKKEIERLQKKCVSLEMDRLTAEVVAGVPVAVHVLDATPKELVTLATKIADGGGIAVLAGGEERIHVVVSSGTERVDARPVVQAICEMIGGRGGGKPVLAQGGGTDREHLEDALEAARSAIYADLNE
ncbi:MAG: hypothetical protein APR53_05875, partial [Methanoculleus sp. SDB]